MNKRKIILMILISTLNIASLGFAFGQQKGGKKGQGEQNDGGNPREELFYTVVPKHNFDIILGRPTKSSIVISVLTYNSVKGYISCSSPNGTIENTQTLSFKANEPVEIILNNLKPNTKYNYFFYYKIDDKQEFQKSNMFSFQTQREANNDFIFTVTADSHLDQNTDTLTYKTTLLNASKDSADFHIDLGDTYMTDKYRNNYKDAFNQYIAQRYYFGLLCSTSPLFFVQGNHDGESGQRLNGKDDNMTVWSANTRIKYFPNPYPDGFYTGNNTKVPFIGLQQNYYSWEWGNSLFIVLDPFTYTPREGMDNPWERTLGKEQYDWLRSTLENTKAKFRFVFIHNLVGGADLKGKARGGSEVSTLFEWGGLNQDGSNGFKAHRSGWEMPIHDLLVKYKVSAVFHGHDHLFAKQERDGIIYQCIPQPGGKGHGNTRHAEEYGYVNGTILNEPGYLRATSSNDQVKVEFIGTSLNGDPNNKRIVFSYILKSK